MNEVCVEHCAINRDASHFEEKPGLKLEDLPRYPVNGTEDMTKDEKFKSIVVYINKVVGYLQGAEDGEDLHSPTSRRVLTDFEKQDVRLGEEGKDTLHPDRKKQENQGERLTSMD
jgi:hypothetical protein